MMSYEGIIENLVNNAPDWGQETRQINIMNSNSPVKCQFLAN